MLWRHVAQRYETIPAVQSRHMYSGQCVADNTKPLGVNNAPLIAHLTTMFNTALRIIGHCCLVAVLACGLYIIHSTIQSCYRFHC